MSDKFFSDIVFPIFAMIVTFAIIGNVFGIFFYRVVSDPTERFCIKDGGEYLGEYGYINEKGIDPFDSVTETYCDEYFKTGVCRYNGKKFTVSLGPYFFWPKHRWIETTSDMCKIEVVE